MRSTGGFVNPTWKKDGRRASTNFRHHYTEFVSILTLLSVACLSLQLLHEAIFQCEPFLRLSHPFFLLVNILLQLPNQPCLSPDRSSCTSASPAALKIGVCSLRPTHHA